MSDFNPKEFDYKLVSDVDDILHYQKSITENPIFIDIMELAFYKEVNTWSILIRTFNLKQFLPDIYFDEDECITLFVGQLKSEFDFRMIMSKIVKDPNVIVKMGC